MTPEMLQQLNAAEAKIYPNYKAVSAATGIPANIWKQAKARNLPGFDTGNRINLAIARPAIIQNCDTLIKAPATTTEKLRNEKLQEEIKNLKLRNKEFEANMLEPEEVKALLVEVATKLSIATKKVINELPPRISGKSEQECKLILDASIQDIFKVFQTKLGNLK